MNARPDFSKFEISSIAARKRWSNGFLILCSVTSTFSIVILVVLISTIVISALPVFGPHSDRYETRGRSLFVQGGDSSSNPDVIDQGDLFQGVFRADKLLRGGLEKRNDESWFEKDEKTGPGPLVIGLYSFQVADRQELLGTLIPATGQQAIGKIVQELGVQSPSNLDNATIIVLSSQSGELDFENLEIDTSLNDEGFLSRLSAITDWEIRLVAGPDAENDFAEIRFSDANNGEVSKLKKTRVRKRAGHLKVLTSILFDSEHSEGDYKNIKLRSWTDNQIVQGQLKIDEAPLVGLSRRKRKGFDLAGDLEVQWCAVPEQDASPVKHATQFLSGKPSASEPAEAGMGPALWGSIWVCTFCALFALPLGIGTAVFLEEFKPANRYLGFAQSLVQLNITNLAGVPSIVYGILGLTAFATMFGMFGSDKEPGFRFGGDYYYQYLSESMNPILVPISDSEEIPELVDGMAAEDGDNQPITLNIIGPDDDLPEDEETLKWTLRSDAQGGMVSELPWYYFQLPFGRGVLAAALTLMLVVLPVIIIAAQEAIKAVPSSLRQGAMGLGATRWQVVRNVTLPAAIPGIMTGAILSISRAIGEAAPIVVLCGTVFYASSPQHLMDFYSVLPIQIFYLTGQPVSEEGLINFQNVAAAASLVLLAVLLTFNTIAIVLRQWTSKPLS